MRFIRYTITCLFILVLYSCFAATSMEFNSARTYARIEDNLIEAEKWAIKAMEIEPDNAQVPWFLANEVYRPQKQKDKVARMFKEALKRKDSDLERPFKASGVEITTVHQAIRNEASSIHNDGIKLLKRGKKNKAIAKFIFSMSLNPRLIENYITLSDMSYDQNNLNEAIEYINEGLIVNNENIDLIFRKSKYARINKEYDLAIKSLQSIQLKSSDKNDNLSIMIDKEIFMIYIDKEDYLNAISHGTVLVEKMLENIDIEDNVLSESCYNLAVCNRTVGYDLYNSVVETINLGVEDKDTITASLANAKEAIIYLKASKEKFYDASSFNPDDKVSSNYAKELNKIIKQLKKLFIPALEKKL
jgi:tetratricopeptide (TPR) repeat protein